MIFILLSPLYLLCLLYYPVLKKAWRHLVFIPRSGHKVHIGSISGEMLTVTNSGEVTLQLVTGYGQLRIIIVTNAGVLVQFTSRNGIPTDEKKFLLSKSKLIHLMCMGEYDQRIEKINNWGDKLETKIKKTK